MKQITAYFRTVTPLFLGGAENTLEAELRPAAIKGALRFWWRTLQWGKGIQDAACLKKKEDTLFGSSEVIKSKDSAGKTIFQGGQARFLLMVESQCQPVEIKKGDVLSRIGDRAVHSSTNPNAIVGDGARYLGYGLMAAFPTRDKLTKKVIKKAGQLDRPCFAAPFEFTVRLIFRNSVADGDVFKEVADALKLLGLCGGIGSRSRRGWGSLTLTKLEENETEIWAAPKTFDEFKSKIEETTGSQKSGAAGLLPEWTAFAAGHSRIVLLQDGIHSPLETLDQMGRDFVFFRSWGKNGKVLNKPSEKNFQFDHDLFRKIQPRDRQTEHPQRITFGLPHNYGKNVQDQVIPANNDLTRRASPLFFHVHQASADNLPIGVLTYLPARFLPERQDKVKFGGPPVELAHDGVGDFWKPVENFLDRVMGADGKHPVTPPLTPSQVTFEQTMEVTL
ncbi:type III-B CRISPR module RAMP protein Cmr1 [uncultured Desulfobacter sp.]|uniref:type III-B CRISPR module RAMP protein Cmr1 n=1 Tax=uncultured Desulfobacter sp. TaxID=240139 RepID=UPI002AAB985F|nr:type III-B CRISPR module RAMP protein Cmr1 [uncultured Desulfobacter sp.]